MAQYAALQRADEIRARAVTSHPHTHTRVPTLDLRTLRGGDRLLGPDNSPRRAGDAHGGAYTSTVAAATAQRGRFAHGLGQPSGGSPIALAHVLTARADYAASGGSARARSVTAVSRRQAATARPGAGVPGAASASGGLGRTAAGPAAPMYDVPAAVPRGARRKAPRSHSSVRSWWDAGSSTGRDVLTTTLKRVSTAGASGGGAGSGDAALDFGGSTGSVTGGGWA